MYLLKIMPDGKKPKITFRKILFKRETDTLLVTSAINPALKSSEIGLVNPLDRLFQLCCSTICWLGTDAIKNIVICDNTLPDYDFLPLRRLAEKLGKNMEILTFSGNREEVKKKGKGFGEGEIIGYALENSQLIDNSSSFYKITGRIFVDNFEAIHRAHLNCERVFDNPISNLRRFAKRIAVNLSANSRHGRGMVRTVFYKCDLAFFKEKLLARNEQVNDSGRFYLEHSYFLPLIKGGFSTFTISPMLVGFSGGSGELYQGFDYSDSLKEKASLLMADMCGLQN